MSTIPFISQLKSLWQAVTGDTAGAKKTQEDFLDAWEHHPGQQISELADNIPIVGHVKGLIHLALGETEEFVHSEEAATRTLAVLGAGALIAGTGGAAAPILAGVAAGVVADAAITGIESVRHQKYDPQGYLGAVSEIGSDWRGGVFDIVALGVGDAVLGADGSVTKAKYKTTKDTASKVKESSSPNAGWSSTARTAIIVPPEDEEKPVRFKQPAVLCLNVGDPSRAETYYAQKLLQYREAVEKLRNDPNAASTSHPTTFQFKIKSFRVLTADSERMFRDVPTTGEPSPAGVRRVDITKTSTSFECPQPVYTPLLEKAIPDTFKEVQPDWLVHMPTRLLEHMRDHQITYGRVRTFVIVASKFGKTSLKANIAQKITDQELSRLQHGPISLSALSGTGIDSIEVRQEPVRRLRQSREVKCGRMISGDTAHSRHMEYLAEFSDGSTFWIPSRNVANDLKIEFWNVMTSGAKEVTEIVSSDSSTGKITVKRPDGSTDIVDQTHVFWQQEVTPSKLTDAELDALLRHGHFGFDLDDFVPCSVTINTDWAKVRIQSTGAAVMKDPAAEKNGEYAGTHVDTRLISFGQEHSNRFVSRTIPFFVANNGALFDIQVTHGRDGRVSGDKQGNIVLNVAGERFVSNVNQENPETNPNTFHIRPLLTTPALLTFKTDWAAVEITSNNATIVTDPTVNQNIYQKVVFTSNSIKLDTGTFGQKFVVPFLILTRDEQIDIRVTHGRDEERYGDKAGVASVLFAQNTYTSPYNPNNSQDNPKSFTGCKVNKRPPVVPL
ncbi:hypothetical protein E1B28_001658 [Marasmius oreades]|uniref:Uncharacterized protein n=1 Tax=Marasmius oreades TaxID=181124 RepID=A0A9P8AFE3_9AGAR|nr:uncharacterized protein E1B28_001658 [Marasmius oreades]KAG7099851.1 hypothetical protein E1B28_001658 [Marasmius oreades]